MSDQPSDETVDVYRENFKYFKTLSKSPTSLLGVNNHNGKETINLCNGDVNDVKWSTDILLPYPNNDQPPVTNQEDSLLRREISYNSQCKCYGMWGLRSPKEWQVAELTFPKGLIVIKNPFTPIGQRYWISRTLLDFPHHVDYITNMDNLNRLHKIKEGKPVNKLADFKLDVCDRNFYSKLRWVTFGYHHDWNTKVYSEERRSKFPEDLADMVGYISQILGFSNFKAEAAIANYYHMDSTLSGHVDRSEVNQGAPLFSLSYGQSAIFLIGGKTKNERPQPVLLQSGDIAIMSGESRLSYHGVPKILPASSETWNMNDVTYPKPESPDRQDSHKRIKLYDACNTVTVDSTSPLSPYEHDCEHFKTTINDQSVLCRLQNMKWTPFLQNYISKSRINLNIRQVLFPGQISLVSEFE
ncbi:unnamed protein product [Orchesella dallaii]|uniref:Alpha-ketoglutarate-dependent dioxygenase AlkB-like domain-containing protein n=1 Tax=Orchesella dallaii TaxID=48710 RepID=A0ABP1PIC9_9HEXA